MILIVCPCSVGYYCNADLFIFLPYFFVYCSAFIGSLKNIHILGFERHFSRLFAKHHPEKCIDYNYNRHES